MKNKNSLWLPLATAAVFGLMTGCQTASVKTTQNTPSKVQSADKSAKAECNLNGELPGSDNWQWFYRNCPASPVAAYNYAVQLLNKDRLDQAKQVISTATKDHPNFEPLQDLNRQMQSPFTGVATRANEKLQAWMQRPSTVPEFKKEVPTKEEYPELPTLVKGEFETSAMFKKRVSKAQSDRAKKIQSIEKKYQRDVAVFNKTVSDYNADLEREKQQRKSSVPKMKRQFLGQAMGEVFGSPRFVEPRYDADRQLFNARLVSAKGNFDKRVTIKVPLSKAESFKRRIEKVEPMLSFDIVNDQIKLSKIQANHDGKQYHAQLTDEIYESIPVSVQLAEVDLPQSENISLMTPEQLNTRALLAENASHFQGALQFEDDPALAKQRQELAELERKKREARILQMKEQERQRLQSQIERNRQELARLGGKAGSDYKGLKMVTAWQFKPAQVQPDMVAVVLGNRNYGKGIPLVHYAHNDAKAVKQFLTDSYGLSAQNILYEEDATKGVMDGIFRKRLRNRVKPGQTDVFVYFSGHGMPVGTDAKLLPSDARPETADINGYSRDEMLQQLAGLNAKSLTVVLDSCYSGSSKAGRALQSVKAILAEPKRVQAPKGSVIISAASGKQTAFMDDQSGHSLLTYYLLEGLKGKADQNGNSQVDTNELQKYLVNEVNNAALRLHDQPQNPQVKGESRVLVQY